MGDQALMCKALSYLKTAHYSSFIKGHSFQMIYWTYCARLWRQNQQSRSILSLVGVEREDINKAESIGLLVFPRGSVCHPAEEPEDSEEPR